MREALVEIDSLPGRRVTDREGRFRLEIDPGTYQVRVDKHGYVGPVYRRVTVLPGRESAAEVVAMTRAETEGTRATVDGGGVIVSRSGRVTVLIPPGALEHDAVIRISEHASHLGLPTQPPAGYLEGSGVDFSPPLSFLKPVTVRVRTKTKIGAAGGIWTGTFDEAERVWTAVAPVTVLSPHELEYQTDHFSNYVDFCSHTPSGSDDSPPNMTCSDCPDSVSASPPEIALHEGRCPPHRNPCLG